MEHRLMKFHSNAIGGSAKEALAKRFIIGQPKATAQFSIEELEKMGVIGLYAVPRNPSTSCKEEQT